MLTPTQIARQRLCRMALLTIALGTAAAISAPAQQNKPTKLLFVSNRAGEKKLNICTMNPDGSEQTVLTKGDALEMDPAWSPDGKRIAFVAGSTVPKEMKTDLYVMNADGTQRTRIAESPAGTFALAPCWSPDGKRIAFCTMQLENTDPTHMNLLAVDPDGKNRKELGEGVLPVWSPDGKQLLFTKGKEHPGIGVMDAGGGNVKQLVDKALMAKWSPDGKQIVFLNVPQGSLPIPTIMNSDGTEAKPIAKLQDQFAAGLEWTADGKRLFFTNIPKDFS